MSFVGNFFRTFKDHFIPSPRNVYRPHLLRRPWLLFFLTVVLTAEGVFVAGILARQTAFNTVAAVLPGEIIALTNGERAQNSVGQLTENSLLDAAAQAKANDMAAKGYFSHVGPDGKQPWAWIAGAGYQYQDAGENLAVRFVDSSDVVNAWMASPTHRANIVKPVYTDIGVGVAQGTYQGQPATFVVQYFGTPLAAASSQTASAAEQEAETPVAALQGDRGQLATGVSASSAQPAVAGAETVQPAAAQAAAAQEQSIWNTFARALARGNVEPGAPVFWILGGVALLLIIGLALAFFIHIQIQATEMLVGGAVVAVIAVSLLVLNTYTPLGPPSPLGSTQTASVFGAMPTGGGFIDANAAQASQ